MFDFLLAPTASSSNKLAQRFYHPVDELQLLNFVTQDVGLFNAQLGIRRNKFFIPMTLKANLPMDLARAYSSGRNMLIWLRDFAIEKRELLKNHLALSKKQQNKCAEDYAREINALDIKIVAAIDCAMYYFWKVEKYFIENPDLSRLMVLTRDKDECEFRLVRSNRAIALEKFVRPTEDEADFPSFFEKVRAIIKASFKETNDVLAIPACWNASKKKNQQKADESISQAKPTSGSCDTSIFLDEVDRSFNNLPGVVVDEVVSPEPAKAEDDTAVTLTLYEYFISTGVYLNEDIDDEQKFDFAELPEKITQAVLKDMGTTNKDLNTLFDRTLCIAPAEMHNYDAGLIDMAAIYAESNPYKRMVHPIVATDLEALQSVAVLNIARLVIKLLEKHGMRLESNQLMTLCANDEPRLSIGTRVIDMVKTIIEELTKQKIEKLKLSKNEFVIGEDKVETEQPDQEGQVSAEVVEKQENQNAAATRRSKKQNQHKA